MHKKRRDDYCNCDCSRIGYKSLIVFRVVTRYYVSRTKNKYAKANRIHICPEHFTDNIERKYFRNTSAQSATVKAKTCALS